MTMDTIDRLSEDWRRELPSLDAATFALAERVHRASALLSEATAGVLARDGLSENTYRLLAELRRAGSPFARAPRALAGPIGVTSGGMTGLIDRAEKAGWVFRRDDPADRRGVLVQLTTQGQSVIDRVLSARAEAVRQVLSRLGPDQQDDLAGLLRRLAPIEDART